MSPFPGQPVPPAGVIRRPGGDTPRFDDIKRRKRRQATHRAAGQSKAWYRKKRWRTLRALILAKNPLCRLCAAAGRATPAQCVDHIVAVRSEHEPGAYDERNLQPLCLACHWQKTANEDRRQPHGRMRT